MRRLLLHRMPALNNIARLPWIKGNIRKLEKGGSLWEPSRLFDNGEEGAWYDPSDLSTMFQDGSGTTPVTADGQPVGKILDKSGRGNHASQATAAARPILQTDGTYWWLQFDGVDDALSTGSIDFSATSAMLVCSGGLVVGGLRVLSELGPTVTSSVGSYGIICNDNGAGNFRVTSNGGNGNGGYNTGNAGLGTKFVLAAQYNFTNVNNTSVPVLNINGAATAKALYGTLNPGSGPYGTWPLYLGSRAGISLPLNGNIYSLIVRGALSSPAEIAQTEAWVNSKTGAY